MNPYQWLGAVSIGLLAVAFGLSVFVLTGRHSRKVVYAVAGTVLAMMVGMTVLCLIIYAEYGGIPAK